MILQDCQNHHKIVDPGGDDVMSKNIIIAFQDDGRFSVTIGGEVSPTEGMNACRAAMGFFQQQAVDIAIEEGIRQRLAESERESQPVMEPNLDIG
jgi:hypothetical protein